MGKPTVFGLTSVRPVLDASQANLPVPVSQIDTGAIVLKEAQLPDAEQRLAKLDFRSISQAEIVTIGLPEEQHLSTTLDGFMARLNRTDAKETFELFTQVKKGVEDAKLPEIIEKIQSPVEPGMFAKFTGMFRGKSASQLKDELFKSISDMITGRTKTLADLLAKMEGEIKSKLAGLLSELQVQQRLKESYLIHFGEFTVAAAVARAFLEKARADVAEEEATLAVNPTDSVQQARVQELQSKLVLLESRALALEGTYTRLPADALVIQQLQQAGVSTVQEVATTMNQRLSSIKMTLLAINGTFQIQGVQMLAERSATMDQQLLDARGQLLKQVAGTAAAAPGNNRLAQAKQIESVIAQVREVGEIVDKAREESKQRMAEARTSFAAARQELARLGSGN